MIGLTKSVAADYVGKGIRCNAICPGTMQSPLLEERLRALGDYEKAREAFIARQPIGRLGTPEEIADPPCIWRRRHTRPGSFTSSTGAGRFNYSMA